MLLFYGEKSNQEDQQPPLPEIPAIDGTDWQTIKSRSTTINYCDFSARANRTAINPPFAVGVSGNPVFETPLHQQGQLLELLAAELTQGIADRLNQARGVFCGFALDFSSDRLVLFTDYIGFRKIFVARLGNRLLFSNALWLLERCLPKDAPFDELSVLEMGVLGYPLDNRTRRQAVRLLPPGSILLSDANGHETNHVYFDLTGIPLIERPEEDSLDAILETWRTAVQSRLRGPRPYAFLSGGMDSRLLVHTLKDLGADPQTANFAPPGTMDRVYAEEAASALGVPLWLHATGDLNINCVMDTINTWARTAHHDIESADHPIIWSGDGGSVGMGNVYLDDRMIELAQMGDYQECARQFCVANKRTPVVRAYSARNIKEDLESSIAASIRQCARKNAERAPYFFLILNDQRRHLDRHYEAIHTRKYDYELPFLDRKVIELIASLPARDFNFHRAYDKLFKRIGGTLNTSPWQTYPGHVPCPLPPHPGLEYQWGGDFYARASKTKQARSHALKTIRLTLKPASHTKFFNRGYLASASLITLLGISDHSYLYQCICPVAD